MGAGPAPAGSSSSPTWGAVDPAGSGPARFHKGCRRRRQRRGSEQRRDGTWSWRERGEAEGQRQGEGQAQRQGCCQGHGWAFGVLGTYSGVSRRETLRRVLSQVALPQVPLGEAPREANRAGQGKGAAGKNFVSATARNYSFKHFAPAPFPIPNKVCPFVEKL